MNKMKKSAATLIFAAMLISFAGTIIIAKEQTADYCPHWPWTKKTRQRCVKHTFEDTGNWFWGCSTANEDDTCIR